MLVAMRLPNVFVNSQVEKRLKLLLLLSTALQTVVVFVIGRAFLPAKYDITDKGLKREVTDFQTSVATGVGLWCGAAIGLVSYGLVEAATLGPPC